MRQHLRREIDKIKKKLLSVSTIAEESVQRAVRSVTHRNGALAAEVIESDPELDDSEVDVEEECLKILALHQPVAIDLRYIVAVLKINNDLERIGDLAVNVAEQGAYLAGQPTVDAPLDFATMADEVRTMLRRSLDALVEMDAEAAHQVRQMDDKVDAANREMHQLVKDGISKNPGQMDTLIRLLRVSNHLERIADHATNIAEDIIYMIEGKIVRHQPEDYLSDGSD